jgi:1,2-phenylacetyl-CoA epoxidase PaaB subunit
MRLKLFNKTSPHLLILYGQYSRNRSVEDHQLMNSITALDPEPALSILDLSLIYLPIA